MKAGLYWNYATRSLVRGGQRTLLAIFCVAIGVLAIVALQLVGNMINDGLTSNVREGNGGDLSIRNDFAPMQAGDLTYFDQLKRQGKITAYTAVSEHDVQTVAGGQTHFYILKAIDPAAFPLVGAPTFDRPSGGSLGSLLAGSGAVVTKNLATALGVHVGDQARVTSDDGRVLDVTIAGVIEDAGFFRRPQMLVAIASYAQAPSTSGRPVDYAAVYVTVPQASDDRAAALAKDVQQQPQFSLATVTTSKQALQQDQSDVQNIRYFLQVVGLLALLIGGVGIINTMQVLLRRRRIEIAMLKTTGYRQHDLYLLFGLEAALLGLLGGVLGAAAGIGVSYLIKQLVEKAFFIHLPYTIDPFTVGAGVVIGFFTALIFGLLPIIQASQTRPQAVLRESGEDTAAGSVLLSGILLVLLAGLFFGLAYSILLNLHVALAVVIGTVALLGVLSGLFSVAVVVISKLPVPERFTWWFVLLLLAALAASAAVTYYLPSFGVIFVAISLLGWVVVVLPRTWKANVKMALRNLGRARVRTVTTMVALFVGVFAIGLVLVLGQNIRDKINNALATQIKYNSFILAQAADKAAVDAQLPGLPGLKGTLVNTLGQGVPLAVNGTPIAQILQRGADHPSADNLGREGALRFLSAIESFDLAGNQLPTSSAYGFTLATTDSQGHQLGGRVLGPADAGTGNVMMARTATLPPLSLKVGDQITLLAADRKSQVTLTIVGFWNDQSALGIGSIFADTSVAGTLSGGKPLYVYSLKEDPTKADQALQQVQQAVPSVQTFSLVDLVLLVNTLLNNLIVMLIAVASLAMVAGIIIIANAVALAMLERRRELGILKSVGHTSASVLREVLLENGMIGVAGGLLAMLLVTAATTILGTVLFKTDLGISTPIVLGVTLATGALTMVVAGLVAWRATRVRPLEVLRYE
jgi:predicted lysophospholipase L1 biosynthesis ABC-type transport system permease subunit